MRLKRRQREWAILAVAAIAVAILAALPGTSLLRSPGSERLVAVYQAPASEICEWENPANTGSTASMQEQYGFARLEPYLAALPAMALLQQETRYRSRTAPPALEAITRTPVYRTIGDPYPTYTAVGVNLQTDEVFLQDNNLWATRVFNRLDNTPRDAKLTEEKRYIQGEQTHIQFNNGLYIDPANGDFYSVESDTGDRMVVFSHDARGNVAPKRLLNTPHRVYSISVDELRKELYVTVEYPPEIVVYRKEASGNEPPLRRIQGDHTRLETPHGVAVDAKNNLLFVNNWGQAASYKNAGTGRFNPAFIAVYALDATGDTPPLRVIQGDKTQLNWPGNMTLHPETGELYVANDVGQSVLVFDGLTHANGNVPPARVIHGDLTALSNPTGIFVDTKHQELWVSNLGSASATVYPLMANGNVPPLRTIRSAPLGHQSLTFGRTAAVAYDPKREQILVPN